MVTPVASQVCPHNAATGAKDWEGLILPGRMSWLDTPGHFGCLQAYAIITLAASQVLVGCGESPLASFQGTDPFFVAIGDIGHS